MTETGGPLRRYRFGRFVIDERRGALQPAAGDHLHRLEFWQHVNHSPFPMALKYGPRWRRLEAEHEDIAANESGAG